MIRAAGLVVILLSACTGTTGPAEGDRRDPDYDPPMDDPPIEDPMGPGGYSLLIDTSETNPYGTLEAPTLSLVGEARASLGLDRVEAGDPATNVPTGPSGDFNTAVVMAPGLNFVELRAHDIEGHSASGHRSLLRADYIPEGGQNEGAAVLAVTDEILSGLTDGVGDLVGDLDLSTELAPGSVLMMDDTCTLYVENVHHDPPTLRAAVLPDGRLDLIVVVTNVSVGFYGQCSALGQDIEVRRGSEADETTVEVHLPLTALPPAPGECVNRFTADTANVAITAFDLDLRLRGGSGLLGTILGLAGELVGEIAEGTIKGMMEDQLGPMVDGVVGPFLDEPISILDTTTEMELFETTMEVGLCLTALEPVDGILMATVGATVRGPGGAGDAPGAPYLEPALPVPTPGRLWLDPNLVGQLLHGAWNGGALTLEDLTADAPPEATALLKVGALTLFARELRELYGPGFGDDTPLEIDVDVKQAPIAWAATPAADPMDPPAEDPPADDPPAEDPPAEDPVLEADVFIGLGDMELTIRAGGEVLFVFGAHIEMALALEGGEGEVLPTYVKEASIARIWIIDSPRVELSERSVEALESTLASLVGDQVAGLLDGLGIPLPDLGAPLSVVDVVAADGGYLEFELGTP